jgi:hypothetical protein
VPGAVLYQLRADGSTCGSRTPSCWVDTVGRVSPHCSYRNFGWRRTFRSCAHPFYAACRMVGAVRGGNAACADPAAEAASLRSAQSISIGRSASGQRWMPGRRCMHSTSSRDMARRPRFSSATTRGSVAGLRLDAPRGLEGTRPPISAARSSWACRPSQPS